MRAVRDNGGVKTAERGPRVASWLLAVASLAGLSACILFVDDRGDLGTTCHLHGELTACGACIMAKCRAQLDACCGDGTCTPILDTIDACIGDYSQPTCLLVSTKPSVVTSAMDKVRDCAADCATLCAATSPGSSGSSGASSGTSGGGVFATSCSNITGVECDCSGDLAPNAVACSSDSVGSGVCCADYGWPDKGLHCNCKPYRCKQTATGCQCSDDSTGPTSTCNGTYCCIFEGWCSCGTTPCDTVSKPVSSCTKATATCPSGRPVTSCSLKPGETLPPLDAGPG